METRKLQEVGGGTFTVSIPKDWAESHGLSSGATVHLYPYRDGSLLIRGSETDGGHLDATTITLEADSPEHVERTIRAANAVGFDRVTLTAPQGLTSVQRRVARRVVRLLIGAEIVAESDTELTVSNLLESADVSVRQSMIQLQFIALSIHERGFATVLDATGANEDRATDRVREATRLVSMLNRHFNRSLISFEESDRLGLDRSQLFDYLTTGQQLMDVAAIGGELDRLGGELSVSPERSMAEDLTAGATAAREAVEVTSSAVLSVTDDRRPAGSILDASELAIERLRSIDPECSTDPTTMAKILDSLVDTAQCADALADIALRSQLRAPSSSP